MKTRFLSRGAVLLLACLGVAPFVSPLAAQNQHISSAANQTFVIGAASTTASTITITDDNGKFKIGSDPYVVIPAALSMIWDNTVATVTITGNAASKVSNVPVYNSGSCVSFTVTTPFAAGDQIIVSGLKLKSFTAAGGPSSLDLGLKDCNSIVATDDKWKIIGTGSATISSAANQAFAYTGPAVNMSTITVTDGATASITAANDIRIRIPTGFNMTWNTGITTATIGGGAAGKVSTTVSYEGSGQTLVLNVTANFAANDQITVSGLQFNNFTATSPYDNLQLLVLGAAGSIANTDDKTITIVAPTMTGAANQTFAVGDPATNMTSVTVTDAAAGPTITAANDIRIRIPTGFNMTWNTSVTTATITGGAAGKVSTTVSYENSGQVLVLNVTTNFAASDQITVSGLQFTSFTAVSAASNLQLVISGSAGGTTVATSDKTKQIVQPTISSAANQTFVVAQAATNISAITVTDNATAATITAANDIRIRIPSGFNMTWNTALTTATIGGGASAKVSTTVTYENSGQVLVLNVTSNFAAGDVITVSGLQYTNFTAASAANNLQLVISGAGGGTTATDNRTITVVAPTISSAANQVFVVAQAATAMSTITVTDGTTASITAANDIRIRVPATFNMVWNTAITTATIGGGAAAKVSTTVSYENAGKTLVLNVTANFAAGNQITVSGLQFTTFTAVSAADYLQLVVGGAGGATNALDSKTVTIVAPTLSSASNKTFAVGDAATAMATATITDDATSASITAANDIRIRIPAGFNMTWNTGVTTATIGGGAAAKVSTTVSYESSGQVLVLNVTSNFAAGDQITVAGLQFNNFTANSAANNLQLVVSGAGGGTAATDDKTVTILTISVSVSPHSTTASKLPSNGTNYTVTFTIQNTGSATDSYDLLITKQPGTFLTTVSIAGTNITQGGNPDSARLANLSAAGSVVATVTYSVGSAAAGALDTLSFTARSVAGPSHTDLGRLTVTVVRPSMTLSKAVNPSGTQPPGTDLTYTATFTNGGTSNAASIVVVDTLPTTVRFKVGSVSNTLPAGVSVVVAYSNDGGTTWTYVPASGACSSPAGYDGCANRIRWTFQNPVSYTPPDNTGTLQFIAKIR